MTGVKKLQIVYENELMHYSFIDMLVHKINATLNLNARAFEFYATMAFILPDISIEIKRLNNSSVGKGGDD